MVDGAQKGVPWPVVKSTLVAGFRAGGGGLPEPVQRWRVVVAALEALCNTSGVLNPKICHAIICIAHHFGVSENFDMHSLKQVYFMIICVDLYG